jgi:threonylcarbamoyladenosine tRNA methylthiotransferase MtaB
MKDKFRIFDVVANFCKQEKTQIEVSCIDDVSTFEASHSTARTRTFVKIQDGCDYSCSFCTIPMARGRSRSEPIGLVVERVEKLADSGAKEIVLSGVNLGLFGEDTGESLLKLLSELDTIDGIRRFRISSIEPNLLTDELVDFVADSRAFVHHFHVPLQSGDDQILGAMRRRYRTATYVDRVNYILRRCPDACIGADVIVGFPDESSSHFLNTFKFVQGLPLAYLHVFSYSVRPDTIAGTRVNTGGTDSIDKRERTRRNGIMRSLSESKRREFYERHLGRTANVLWEGRPMPESNGTNAPIDSARRMYGHTDNYVRVQSAFDPGRLRKFDSVRLLAIDERDPALSVLVEPA